MDSSDTSQLKIRSFVWECDAELVKKFHEETVVTSFPPRNMSEETYRRKLRLSEKNGLPAYMRVLRKAYTEKKDGIFMWEIKGDVVGWSWLKIRENEFFKEGCYGELNEIYVTKKWRRRGVGEKIMKHAHNWLKKRGANTVRVETAASNQAALTLYRKFGYKPHYISLQRELLTEEDQK